jgi:hypothetical protein
METSMRADDLREAMRLVAAREEMEWCLKELNDINRGAYVSIPTKVLEHVDPILASKGLCSLLVEALRANEEKLQEMGITIT